MQHTNTGGIIIIYHCNILSVTSPWAEVFHYGLTSIADTENETLTHDKTLTNLPPKPYKYGMHSGEECLLARLFTSCHARSVHVTHLQSVKLLRNPFLDFVTTSKHTW